MFRVRFSQGDGEFVFWRRPCSPWHHVIRLCDQGPTDLESLPHPLGLILSSLWKLPLMASWTSCPGVYWTWLLGSDTQGQWGSPSPSPVLSLLCHGVQCSSSVESAPHAALWLCAPTFIQIRRIPPLLWLHLHLSLPWGARFLHGTALSSIPFPAGLSAMTCLWVSVWNVCFSFILKTICVGYRRPGANYFLLAPWRCKSILFWVLSLHCSL